MNEHTCLSGHEFTTWVAEQIRHGLRLVPFIGSGFSAASGILTSQSFVETLTWVVFRCVAPTELQPNGRRLATSEGWPISPQGTEIEKARTWVAENFKAACRSCGLSVAMENGFVRVLYSSPTASPAQLESALRRPLVPAILRDAETQVDDAAVRELLRLLRQEDQTRDFLAPPDVSTSSEAYIIESAVRSLHDWRATLRFLARLDIIRDPRNAKFCRLKLGPIRGSVIDSFNTHITTGRRPNLAHTMLCHLAQRARIRLILTTNFDSLIEDAFKEIGVHLKTESVHLQDLSLPDPELIHEQNCVLKMHGERIETRADDTLDAPPSEEDKRRFFHYVQGHPPEQPPGQGRFLAGLLLVCGYSGSDLRCIQMIKHLLDAETHAKVLWICHSQGDLQRLYKMFDLQGYRIARNAADLDPVNAHWQPVRIVATVTDRTDLLLYELYQRLTLSLPPGGLSYEFAHAVPAGTSFTQSPRTEEETGDFAQRLISAVLEEASSVQPRIVVADGESGLSGPLRQAFHKLTRTHHKRGIWLELEDYPDVVSLGHEIFTILALRLGEFQNGYVNFEPILADDGTEDWAKLIETLLMRWGIDPAEWLIVLNGRNGPGGCAGWLQAYWEGKREYFDPDTQKPGRLHHLMAALRAARPYAASNASSLVPGGFNIVYAPYSRRRATRDDKNQRDMAAIVPRMLIRKGAEQAAFESTREANDHQVGLISQHDIASEDPKAIFYRTVLLQPSLPRMFLRNLRYVVNNWIAPQTALRVEDAYLQPALPEPAVAELHEEAVWSRRFLYATVLFRQARHFTAFLSEGVYPNPRRYSAMGYDNDWLRYEYVFNWLVQLNENGRIFFRKPGGFAWMYRDMRLAIRSIFEQLGPTELSPRVVYEYPVQAKARMHFWIADWYSRAFQATGHAVPLLEALYHYGQSAIFARWARPGRPPGHLEQDDPTLIRQYRQTTARRAVLEILKSLRTGRECLRFWLQNGSGEAWFGLGEQAGGDKFIQELFSKLQDPAVFGFAPDEPAAQPPSKVTPLNDVESWQEQLKEQFRVLPQSERGKFPRQMHDPKPIITSAPFRWFELGPQVCVEAREDPVWRDELLGGSKSCHGACVLDYLPKIGGQDRPWRDLLGLLSTHVILITEDPTADKEREDRLSGSLKDWRNEHLESITEDGATNHATVQAIFELAYLHVRRVKLLTHAEEDRFGETSGLKPERQREINQLWVQVCALCWLGLDLCYELPPIYWEKDLRERSRLSHLYGIALGRLGRFFEAHRRLNEAHALLSQPKQMHSAREQGVLALRRAEVHLQEARLLRRLLACCTREATKFLSSSAPVVESGAGIGEAHAAVCCWPVKLEEIFEPLLFHLSAREQTAVSGQWRSIYCGSEVSAFDDPNADDENKQFVWIAVCRRLRRLHYAKLDDAWLVLESAAEHFKDYHDPLWSGKLYAEILLIYAEHWVGPKGCDPELEIPTALIFRKREDHFSEFIKFYRKGMSGTKMSTYREIRFLEYAQKATLNLDAIYPNQYERQVHEFIGQLEERARQLHAKRKHESPRADSLLSDYVARVCSTFS